MCAAGYLFHFILAPYHVPSDEVVSVVKELFAQSEHTAHHKSKCRRLVKFHFQQITIHSARYDALKFPFFIVMIAKVGSASSEARVVHLDHASVPIIA